MRSASLAKQVLIPDISAINIKMNDVYFVFIKALAMRETP
jgi:hypothetical protein